MEARNRVIFKIGTVNIEYICCRDSLIVVHFQGNQGSLKNGPLNSALARIQIQLLRYIPKSEETIYKTQAFVWWSSRQSLKPLKMQERGPEREREECSRAHPKLDTNLRCRHVNSNAINRRITKLSISHMCEPLITSDRQLQGTTRSSSFRHPTALSTPSSDPGSSGCQHLPSG